MNRLPVVGIAAALLVAACPVFADDAAPPAPSEAVVSKDMDVGLQYTLSVDGVIVDSTEGQGPWHYIHGHQQMIPGLERQLEGLRAGDQRDITVNPEEGYGESDPALFVEVPVSDLPADVAPKPGVVLRGVNPDGQSFQARIAEVKPESVVLDLNHPLAGKTLRFSVQVADVAPVGSQ
jgi:FKBP-type peptidyl-prolyl cis-trans isomerase SlyD